jgi:hypothetical protein
MKPLDGNPAGQPRLGSADEPWVELQELAWAYDAPLVLKQRGSYPRERWVLEQAGRPVTAIEGTTTGWSLATPAERWSVVVRRRRWHLGWHLEFSRTDGREPQLYYYPHTLLPGGALAVAGGDRFKLRGPLVLGVHWTLDALRGAELARIRLSTSIMRASDRDALRAGLTTSARSEPMLVPLMAAACLAIVIHRAQPRLVGPPP